MTFGLHKEFDEPQDSRDETLWDAFVCVHMFPEDVPAKRPDYGFLARIRDGIRIRQDIRKAIGALGLKNADNKASDQEINRS